MLGSHTVAFCARGGARAVDPLTRFEASRTERATVASNSHPSSRAYPPIPVTQVARSHYGYRQTVQGQRVLVVMHLWSVTERSFRCQSYRLVAIRGECPTTQPPRCSNG